MLLDWVSSRGMSRTKQRDLGVATTVRTVPRVSSDAGDPPGDTRCTTGRTTLAVIAAVISDPAAEQLKRLHSAGIPLVQILGEPIEGRPLGSRRAELIARESTGPLEAAR